MVGTRPFWGTLGVMIFGPKADDEAERAKQSRMLELQKVIRAALPFKALKESEGWKTYQAHADKLISDATKRLTNAKVEEFTIVQARLKAFEEMNALVDAALEEADAAIEELEKLSEEE